MSYEVLEQSGTPFRGQKRSEWDQLSSFQPSALSFELRPMSYQLSATSYQPPATNHQSPLTLKIIDLMAIMC